MASSDESSSDEFIEPFLRFRIVKPARWSFVPPAWSPIAQLRNAAEGQLEWLKHASQPFVCFMKKHESETHVYPTVQATARPTAIPPPDLARLILDRQIELVGQMYEDLEVISATTDAIVAGHRANRLVARGNLITERDGEERAFDVVLRAMSIFTPGIAFTVGMTSSADPEFSAEEELPAVIQSITIG